MNMLELEMERAGAVTPLRFAVRRMVNVGYSGRDQDAVRAHIEELRAEGVPPPASVPLCIPVAARNVTTDDEIEVLPGRTSGEAEAVFLIDGPRILVGVGSDHTDRDLEALSIEKSKQVCPNVTSRRVWAFEDIVERWDQLVLRSFVAEDEAAKPDLYQSAPLAKLLPAMRIVEYALESLPQRSREGLVVFSGTVPLRGEMRCGGYFRAELFDEATGRMLSSAYRVRTLATAK